MCGLLGYETASGGEENQENVSLSFMLESSWPGQMRALILGMFYSNGWPPEPHCFYMGLKK